MGLFAVPMNVLFFTYTTTAEYALRYLMAERSTQPCSGENVICSDRRSDEIIRSNLIREELTTSSQLYDEYLNELEHKMSNKVMPVSLNSCKIW